MTTLTEMPKYESYKYSGEEWIGDIPKHWVSQKLKHIFYEKKHKSNMSLSCGAISFGRVVDKGDEKVTEATKKSYQEVLNGEFLINPLNLNYDLISLRIALSEINVVVSAGYIVLKEKTNLDKNYFKYLLHRYDVAYMKLLGSGVRQTISFSHISNSLLLLPPIEEQTAIANFLDEKTSKIDEAIAIKEKQIELLKERKQIIIQQAVTQGLDPSVPMKDSGVEWIGQIPAHWNVVKLKYLSTQIVDGTHFTPTYVDQGIPFLRVTDLSNMVDGKINWQDVCYIPEKEHNTLIKRAKGEIGDVLISKNGTIGLTKVIDWDEEFSFFVSLCLIKLRKEISPYYFTSFFNSPIVDQQITFGSSKTSVTNLHLEKIKELLVILPPLNEQNDIDEYVKANSKDLDLVIGSLLKQIEKLNEYKTTLINSAVTGKIKVV